VERAGIVELEIARAESAHGKMTIADLQVRGSPSTTPAPSDDHVARSYRSASGGIVTMEGRGCEKRRSHRDEGDAVCAADDSC